MMLRESSNMVQSSELPETIVLFFCCISDLLETHCTTALVLRRLTLSWQLMDTSYLT